MYTIDLSNKSNIIKEISDIKIIINEMNIKEIKNERTW